MTATMELPAAMPSTEKLPRDSVAAIAPTLSCIETSLLALNGAVERLRRLALQRLAAPVLTAEDLRPLRADVSLRMERLAGILEQCSLERAAAREALDPAADELTAVWG
jgi:hypothetical protein